MGVPAAVRSKAVAAGAGWWLDELPALLDELAARWAMSIGPAYSEGTEAYVAEALTADGRPAVLKVVVPGPDPGARHEATVLRLAAGEACAELFDHDLDRAALLMERLGPSLFRLGLPIGERHRILCDLATRLWRPAPDCGLPTGADKAAWLIDRIQTWWTELDRPCSARAVAHAVACAGRRQGAHDDERAVLVHGDIHEWNALRAGKGFKLIDADGLLAEPAYDLGIMMREDPVELLAGDPLDRARWLADRCGLDATAIWEWGVAERVSTGLLATAIDLQPIGREMLEVADRLALSWRDG